MKNFVMSLTISRLISGPIIFFLANVFEQYLIAFVIFLLSAVTDFFDGFLARRYQAESSLGKVLDPIADKIILVCALVSINLLIDSIYIGFLSIIIISREIWVSGLREHNSQMGKISKTSVSLLAKYKTTTQFFSIALYYYSFAYNLALGFFIAGFILFLSAVLSIKTALDYTKNTFQEN